ncbi:four helix bundle protein [Salibacteraceae bacterium]|nr:four helix bundle protein [Salibacteraceae bacterium]
MKYDLEDRLIDFSNSVIDFVEDLPNSYLSQYLGSQLMRSSISPALNYGEAQAAESSKDFVHKMKICLKELRESMVCLKLFKKRNIAVTKLLQENNELISIFYKSIKTAQSKL